MGVRTVADYRGRDIQFCATCVWIQHEKPHVFVCSRLGYETKPRYKFRCWTPRPQYRTSVQDENHS
ncbi:MAG: hypothetical protein C7B45_09740 [Sulfobacillus acidophilus]|uniref:Uncharacterized protein n=1 Tax=Sulfobacillus acidophilus TaxID=53633 RepID=A0A2T2WHP0_9FIRM|nr:MAG: hypothetical protein C7B45_09740 [Sulfobacillus acidophilus]